NKGLYEIQKLLDALHGAMPKMSPIASDFNYITDVKISRLTYCWYRYNVFDDDQLSVRKDGCGTEYNSYLDAKGDEDIFFQTDFVYVIRNLKITIIQVGDHDGESAI
ncbi:hypothetical protein Tco_0929469, partial [Tanacetum coccineum]